MEEAFIRSKMLFGEDSIEWLSRKKVIVFGVGGVGGHAAEVLARSGIGEIHLLDHDEVSVTNINRQMVATTKTIGRKKVEVMRERILDINPECKVEIFDMFYLPTEEEKDAFVLEGYDYIIDAIDTISAKIDLAVRAQQLGIGIISAMGAGNKVDPTKFEVSDIYKTSVCPLAKVMRRELKNRRIKKLKVVYSKEIPQKPGIIEAIKEGSRPAPGSCAFVPGVVGMIMAGEVVKDLLQKEKMDRGIK